MDLSPSPPAAPAAAVVPTSKNPINIHDWSVWRMQLNEQMGGGLIDRRTELKQIRQFLQNNSFYQQHCRDPSNGRFNGVRLLFSIPRAKFRAEVLDNSRGGTSKPTTSEITEEIPSYQPQKFRSHSDERTTSATLVPPIQPNLVMDKTISQLFPKTVVENTGGFLQVNEQMIAADTMRTRRTGRSSFRATDRIHSTLQKAVKDGNVLEKIKAFEMQAAAAQAESAMKLSGLNHRVQTVTSSLQSAAYRTLSPAIVHPVQHPITPVPTHQQQQQQPVRSGRDQHVHPVQHRRDASHGPMLGHGSRKGAHVLEPAHGDIILRRRTPSQRTAHDEDYSITAISSLAMTNSQNHHQHRSRQQQQHRTNASRSRHRQEMIYDKRAPSTNHEHNSHKHQQKQKRTTTPSSKSSAHRRRWLKGRKETPTQTPIPNEKQELPAAKSSKSSKNKKKTAEQEKVNNSKKGSTSDAKRKSLSDNNRVYGVPNPETNDPIKLESTPPPPPPKLDAKVESDPEKDNTNTYMAPKAIELDPQRECALVQRRTSKKQHQHKLSSTDGEILNKMAETIDPNDDEVFLADSPIKPPLNMTRHQSIVNLPNSEARHYQRHISQCSAEELTSNARRYQRPNENLPKKKSLPLTIITRKNKLNPDEQNVYETPHSEQVHTPTCNSHTLKKQRPFHTINASGNTNTKQISKQILHAIMNSMNNTQEQPPATRTSSVYDEFFENGPLTNPEDTLANITT